MENSVGALQEFTMKAGYPSPVYGACGSRGKSHMMTFEICCKVGSIEERAEGASKKEAKKLAAAKVYDRLKSGDLDTAASNGRVNIGDVVRSVSPLHEVDVSMIEKLEWITNIKVDVLTKEAGEKVANFYRQLEKSDGPLITKLSGSYMSESNVNFVELLKEVGREQEFEVTFEELDFATDEGYMQCLVKLVNLPVTVAYGMGEDMEEAKKQAARAALNYIILMVKAVKK